MTLDEFSKQIMTPMVVRRIEAGKLDNAIFDPDCADIEFSPDVKAAIEARKAVLRNIRPSNPFAPNPQ